MMISTSFYHGIDHTRLALRDAGRGVTEARLLGRTLEGERTEDVDVVEIFELVAEAKGTTGGDHGIIQLQPTQNYGCISYHITSSFNRTGPSLQMRLLPYLVLHEQPMQAPKPQPIRSSNES